MDKETLNRHMNQILVHSYLYSVNHAIWDDYTWDMYAKNLAKEIKENRELAKTLPYYEQFIDWEGDTAMNFKYDDTIKMRARFCYACKFGEPLDENA